MSDLLRVSLGADPWRPGQDVELVETLDSYDGPTMVLLRQGSMTYIGRSLIGALSTTGIWLYSGLSEQQTQTLQDAQTASEVDGVWEASAGGWCLAALMHHGKVAYAIQVHVPSWTRDMELLEAVAIQLSEGVQELAGDVGRARELLASVN